MTAYIPWAIATSNHSCAYIDVATRGLAWRTEKEERQWTRRPSALRDSFRFDRGMMEHLKVNAGSAAGFAGAVWSNVLLFDLDRENLDDALGDARRLVTVLLHRYTKLDDTEIALYFSGKKGVHIGLPLTHRPDPGSTFHLTARTLAGRLAKLAGVVIDGGIYDKVRPFRLPNSRHPKTGLHKIRLEHRELMHLSADAVRKLAENPRPFDPPRLASELVTELEYDWNQAADAAARQVSAKIAIRIEDVAAGGPDRLNRATLDFIANGVGEGDRHRLLFSAACNLAEFGCPARLAFALLMPSALDSGLTPNDAGRQIECGLNAIVTPLPAGGCSGG